MARIITCSWWRCCCWMPWPTRWASHFHAFIIFDPANEYIYIYIFSYEEVPSSGKTVTHMYICVHIYIYIYIHMYIYIYINTKLWAIDVSSIFTQLFLWISTSRTLFRPPDLRFDRGASHLPGRFVVPALGRAAVRGESPILCEMGEGYPQRRDIQWIGLRDILQESPIFNGKIYGFLFKFSLKPIHWDIIQKCSSCAGLGPLGIYNPLGAKKKLGKTLELKG